MVIYTSYKLCKANSNIDALANDGYQVINNGRRNASIFTLVFNLVSSLYWDREDCVLITKPTRWTAARVRAES